MSTSFVVPAHSTLLSFIASTSTSSEGDDSYSSSATSCRATSETGLSSVPSSEIGESESSSEDDNNEDLVITDSEIEVVVKQEEENDYVEEDADTRHARAVIAARALFAGICALSSFTSPCHSRQELVDEYDGGFLGLARLGLEPMKLVLNVATPTAKGSTVTTATFRRTASSSKATTPPTVAVRAAPPSSSNTYKIITPCSTPTATTPVPYPLAASSAFLRLQ